MAEKITINNELPPLSDDLRAWGLSLQVQGHVERALRMTEYAIKENPNDVQCLGQMATLLINKKDYDDALSYLDKAIKIDPNNKFLHYVFSRYFYSKDLYDEALSWAESALEIDEKFGDANIMAAMIWQIRGKRHMQTMYHNLACMNDPMQVELRTWLALDLLLAGDWDKGLELFESRLAVPGSNPIPQNGVQIWNGEDLIGKTIVVYAEQGAGDCIQFIRFAKTLKDHFHADKVIFASHIPYLNSLLNYAKGVDRVVDVHKEQVQGHNYQIAMMSLMRHIPRELWSENWDVFNFPESIISLAKEYALFHSVGLCWRGNTKHSNDARRSLSLQQILSVIPEETDFKFLNMQYSPTLDEIHDMKSTGVSLTGVEPKEVDMLGFALRMLRCGKVVTCDTVVGHLAGSLGIETKLLLPPGPDWRWGFEGDKAMWYPSLTLYRAKKPREWDDVTRKIRKEFSKPEVKVLGEDGK